MKQTFIGLAVAVLVVAAYFVVMRPQGTDVLPSPTPVPVVGDTATYTSETLGLTFSYAPKTEYGGYAVKETGSRVYVYSDKSEPETGQFVEVFEKQADETFEAAIRRLILASYPDARCTVDVVRASGSDDLWTASIGYPEPDSSDEPFWANAKLCNQAYARSNGIRYFLYDDAHADRFLFLDIGQYSIPGEGDAPWQDTLRLIAR